MYDRDEFEEVRLLRYVHHTIEDAAYTLDQRFRILRETIEQREKYHPQCLLSEKKYGWTMPAPERRVWGIVRYAGYSPLRDTQGQTITCQTLEEALEVIKQYQPQ